MNKARRSEAVAPGIDPTARHAAAEAAKEAAKKTSSAMESQRTVGRVVRGSVSFAAAAPRAAVRVVRQSVKFLTGRKSSATPEEMSKALADPAGELRPSSNAPPDPFQVDLKVPIMRQDRNACGTTSLAMIGEFFGRSISPQEIDRAIRTYGLGTAPDNLLSFARDNGFRAEMKNEASIDDLTRMIDQGVPPMIMVEPGDPNDMTLHYVVVSGYDRGPDGEVSRLKLTDPNGREREVTPQELMASWDNLRVRNVSTGDRRLMLTFVPEGNQPITAPDGSVRPASSIELPKSSLGADLRNMPSRTFSDGLSDVANGFNRGQIGDIFGGALEAIGGGWAFAISKIPIPGFRELGGVIAHGSTSRPCRCARSATPSRAWAEASVASSAACSKRFASGGWPPR